MKTLEFPFSFIRRPDPFSTIGSAQKSHGKMTRSADFISFNSASCSLVGTDDKVHLDVEDGDDYNSEEDLCESSPLRQPDLVSHIPATGKRPADGQGGTCNPPDNARLTPRSASKALTLPENVWADIFSRLPPQNLAQLRRTCRAFQNYLLNQSIWRASRKQWMPEMPKPAFNLKEWEMLALAKGDGCMICRHKTYTRAIYWAFRVRCCTQCFNQNMTKVGNSQSRLIILD